MRYRRGFTLVELLISMSLLSILLVVIYSSFANITDIIGDCRKRERVFRRVTLAFRQMAHDLEGAYLSKENERLLFTGTLDSSEGVRRDSLNFATTSFWRKKDSSGEYDLKEVSYSLREVSPGDYLLERKEKPAWGDLKGEDSRTMDFGRGFKSLKIEYFDGKDWVEEWDSGAQGELPVSLKITLEAFTDGEKVSQFTTEVFLPLGNPSYKK